ncbi:hypothetical protein AGMMS49543_23850 [Betaproteobacteria bacterium]|nr:hypothetical protein AGMMS49543_23850 [Betaproteobacteria bacterium]GHU19495.1 hypothetical protein AGMMS50243_11640 [Betaproteobacteria bacterium]
MEQVQTAAEIVARYADGARSFTALDLDDREYDFSGCMLDDVDFSESFIFASFRGASLARARFRNANVKTCDFTGANLESAEFEGAAIDAAVFDGANLTGASFVGASEQGHLYQVGEIPFRNAT